MALGQVSVGTQRTDLGPGADNEGGKATGKPSRAWSKKHFSHSK